MFIAAAKSYPADIRSLTSLRFFAAMCVAVFHYVSIFDFFKIGSGFFGKSYLGVDFFFILSGFILTHTYMTAIKDKRFAWSDFYIRRLARIYPVHLATLLFAVGIYWNLDHTIFLQPAVMECFLSSLFLLHAWGTVPELCFNMPSWSISAEWFAYLLFPFITPFLLRFRPEILLPAALLSFGALYWVYPQFFPVILTQATHQFSILRILPEFILGMAVCLFGYKYGLRVPVGFVIAAAVILIVALAEINAPDALIVPVFALLIYAVAEKERQGDHSLLANKILVHLGKISYSLYMTHTLVIWAVIAPLVPRDAEGDVIFNTFFYTIWCAGILSLIPLAHLMYEKIEKPARQWINARFTGRSACAADIIN